MTLLINRCRVLDGLDALPEIIAESDANTSVVVYDKALSGNPGFLFLQGLISSSGMDTILLEIDRMGDVEDARNIARHISRRLSGSEWVVAFGGGSLIDSVKLAMALNDPLTARIVAARQRSGWVLGPDRARSAGLVAVPTTIGTAAEVSGVAGFTDGTAKRAFTSLALQPDFAVLDARASAGMPYEVLVEGCLEIVLRCVGPVIGATGPLTGTDHRVLRLAAAAVAELTGIHRAGRADGKARKRLAWLSATSQESGHLRDRAAFTVKAWFLANNLSHHLRVRKMQALANLIPAYWDRLPTAAGLGSAARAGQVWEILREEIPVPVSDEPGTGFSQWLDWLEIPPLDPISGDELEQVTRSCVRMWGGGLPMLAGVGISDIREVLRGVRGTPANPGDAPAPARAHGAPPNTPAFSRG